MRYWGEKRIVLVLIHFFVSSLFSCDNTRSFYLGVENMSPDLLEWMRHYRVGVVTNQTGVDQSGRRTVDVLKDKGITVCALFAPEHGINGVIRAEQAVSDTWDEIANIPVISLYSSGAQSKVIKQQTFQDIDIIVFDIQDSGMRHYTYISTLFEVLKAAAAFGKSVVVCDRPNPLGGIMEGPLVEDELKSFISIASIPVRHGMTIGEIALYFNTTVLDVPAKLRVAKMRGYNRVDGIVGELLKGLSPNIVSKASCHGYSFLGLLGEIKPFHIGVGTDKAFQCIMLPKDLKFPIHKWHAFSVLLDQMQIQNTIYSYFNVDKKQWFEGVRIRIKDINQLQSFSTFMRIVFFFKEAGVPLKCATLFDKAVGTRLVQILLEGGCSKNELVDYVNSSLKNFFNRARHAFLYEPLPQVVSVVM